MPSQDWTQWILSNFVYIINLHLLFVSFLVCFGLLLIHLNLMLTNTTTWEKFARRNITYLRSIKDDSANPFHESYLKNIVQFCCYCKSIEWESIYNKYASKTSCVTITTATTRSSRNGINLEIISASHQSETQSSSSSE